MKPLKEKISITIDSDILEAARAAAEADDRSLSQYINMAVKAYLSKHYVNESSEEKQSHIP
ncbi:MAG: toxin-antitoxin system protein [Clostridiales bacterium]|nr:toxin-antitoxin system protein [Clostridiales bacterium]